MMYVGAVKGVSVHAIVLFIMTERMKKENSFLGHWYGLWKISAFWCSPIYACQTVRSISFAPTHLEHPKQVMQYSSCRSIPPSICTKQTSRSDAMQFKITLGRPPKCIVTTRLSGRIQPR